MTRFRTSLRSSLLLALLISACNWTTTRELLDLTFLDKIARKFQVTSPSLVESGTPFNVVVVYTDTNGGKSAGKFADYLNWEVVGSGTLTQTAPGTITSGVYQATLIYSNSALTTGQSATVVLKAIDPNNASVSGISGSVTAKFPVSLSTFKFSVPTLVFQTTAFTATISAVATDGSVMSGYNGTVNLTATVTGMTTPDGILTPATATFSNGIATVSNVQYTKPAGSLYIVATDVSDTSKTGTSSGLQIAGDAFSLTAVPVDVDTNGTMDSVRISWTTPLNGNRYNVYRESSPGVFTQLSNSPVFNTSVIEDNGPGLTLGQTYTYKVEARNTLGDILKDGNVQVLFKNCTTTISAGISSNTNWTLAGSPYCVTASIPLTAVLTIDPGVLVLVSGLTSGIMINAGGAIKGNGTATQPIIFTAAAYSPASPAWAGINNAAGVANDLIVTAPVNEAISEAKGPLDLGTTLQYTVIEYAETAFISTRPAWFENCLFRKNSNNNTLTDAAGGKVALAATDWVVYKNNAFVQNINTSGSAYGDLIVSTGKVVLRNNTFQGTITSNASRLKLASGSSSTLNGNSFYTGTYQGYGIYITGGGNPIIRNNLFSGSTSGAAPVDAAFVPATIVGNTFENCSGQTAGAILNTGNGTLISKNIFKATSATGAGGAGAINMGGTGNTMSGNVFISTQGTNAASTAAAILFSNTGHTIQNNSFYSTYSANRGGAIVDQGTNSIIISYNHFYSTNAVNAGGAIYTAVPSETGLIITHNNFVGTTKGGSTPNAISNTITADYTVSNNWWGSDYSATTACQAVAGNLCETTAASIPTLTGNRSAAAGAWPLCCAAPSDPNCVGASTLPTGQACN